jgi:hypothetical protein
MPLQAQIHAQAPVAGPTGEPAFGLDQARELHVGAQWPVGSAGAFLAHGIARNPGNLRAHVQRVLLWIEAAHPGETYAALLDLFVALGPHGQALRARLLRAAQPVLPREGAQFLLQSHRAGISGREPHPPAPGSMLSRGVTGALALVTRVHAAAAAADPIRDADDYIAEGNVAAARVTLEEALIAEPTRPDLAGALLDIYRRTRDARALAAMRARLGHSLRIAGVWDEVEREIKSPPGGAR